MMTNSQTGSPNSESAAVATNNADPGLDSIVAKMAALRAQTSQQRIRNLDDTTNPSETGEVTVAKVTTPVAPDETETKEDSSRVEGSVSPEVEPQDDKDAESTDDLDAPKSVSDESPSDVIDFIEFANENPTAKFKFMKDGKPIEIDAKKAAAILGQGGAIHEEARQLKVEKSEFEEYSKKKREESEGLTLAMQMTVEPRLQQAYDEVIKTQGYQSQFQRMLANTTDPTTQARIRADMQQNERHIAAQAQFINQMQPNVDHFKQVRKQQVAQVLEEQRQQFKDKELRNKFIYDELRGKIAKGWQGAERQLVPGVANIDLVSSDEHLLSLIRDGYKYREKPQIKSAGGSIAALTQKKTNHIPKNVGDEENLDTLREQARSGNKKAADNLLIAQLNKVRRGRQTRR